MERAQKSKNGRSVIFKACPKCGTAFTVTTRNRRKTYCSVKCGLDAIHQSRKIVIPEQALRDAVATTDSYVEVCEKLGVSAWTLYRRMHEIGLVREKRPYKKRVDGYWSYKAPANHRRAMERHLGRPLLVREQVHHIDGNKAHNDPEENLVVATDAADHNAMHHSLQQCGYLLYRKGLIQFDRELRRYVLPAGDLT